MTRRRFLRSAGAATAGISLLSNGLVLDVLANYSGTGWQWIPTDPPTVAVFPTYATCTTPGSLKCNGGPAIVITTTIDGHSNGGVTAHFTDTNQQWIPYALSGRVNGTTFSPTGPYQASNVPSNP